MSEDQSEVIAFLSKPETFGIAEPPCRRETHASIIFIAGERAYKLKRAVRFPYLDFSTCERRRTCCEAEVRINRRTAPALYRGVVAVTSEAGGGLALNGAGVPVDWLVEMVRFDELALFNAMAERDALTRHLLEDLADEIAAFHREAEPRTKAGGSAAMAALIENNAQSFAACADDAFDRGEVARLLGGWSESLVQQRELFDQRRDAGRVRHCHGDLHLRNIVLHEGRPTLFDAIEFNDAFAEIDVLYDLAFLLMDLGFRGHNDLAGIVLNRYLDGSGDGSGLAALPLFLSLRAGIRAHVEAAAARAHSKREEGRRLILVARRYLDQALAALSPPPPRLVAIGGLSGSGKSELARALAPDLGTTPAARVLRTDCIRKRLAGIPLSAVLEPSGYSRERTEQTYGALYAEAGRALGAGCAVIADGVFAAASERAAIAAVATRCGVPFTGLWLDAPTAILEMRVTSRQGDASDARAEVVRMQQGLDLGAIDWRRVDASGPAASTAAAARRLLEINPETKEHNSNGPLLSTRAPP